MTILCVVCGQNIEEGEGGKLYAEHMQKLHPGGQLGTIAAKKNVPHPQMPQGLPPGITEANLPDAEFLKTVEEISKAASKPKEQPQVKAKVETPSEAPVVNRKPQPIELTYHYNGECSKLHTISTLELDLGEKHFAIAYCTVCKSQESAREVENLKSKKVK